jgi:hypothetical protein
MRFTAPRQDAICLLSREERSDELGKEVQHSLRCFDLWKSGPSKSLSRKKLGMNERRPGGGAKQKLIRGLGCAKMIGVSQTNTSTRGC